MMHKSVMAQCLYNELCMYIKVMYVQEGFWAKIEVCWSNERGRHECLSIVILTLFSAKALLYSTMLKDTRL